MISTALGAEKAIIFISDAHEKFYYEKIKEVRYQDVYHKALCYCLSISAYTRKNVNCIYDFKSGNVKAECQHQESKVDVIQPQPVALVFENYKMSMVRMYLRLI